MKSYKKYLKNNFVVAVIERKDCYIQKLRSSIRFSI